MNPVKIPNRKQVLQEAKDEAALFLRTFDARRYAGYVDRIAKPFEYLDGIGINKICELVEHGNGLLNIAELVDLSPNVLRLWINKDSQRIQKIDLAREFSGDAFAYKAERVLKEARFETKDNMLIAAKLADHYRWMAEKLYRTQYGPPKEQKTSPQALVLNINYGNENPPTGLQKEVIDITPKNISLPGFKIDLGSLGDEE